VEEDMQGQGEGVEAPADNPKLPPPVLKGNDHIKEYVGAAVAYFLRRQDWSPDAMALPLSTSFLSWSAPRPAPHVAAMG